MGLDDLQRSVLLLADVGILFPIRRDCRDGRRGSSLTTISAAERLWVARRSSRVSRTQSIGSASVGCSSRRRDPTRTARTGERQPRCSMPTRGVGRSAIRSVSCGLMGSLIHGGPHLWPASSGLEVRSSPRHRPRVSSCLARAIATTYVPTTRSTKTSPRPRTPSSSRWHSGPTNSTRLENSDGRGRGNSPVELTFGPGMHLPGTVVDSEYHEYNVY